MRSLGIVLDEVLIEDGRISSRVSNQVRRPSTRKCSSRSVRCQRSTMPFDWGRLTRIRLCSMSSSCRNSS
jgi:hypothetical protein